MYIGTVVYYGHYSRSQYLQVADKEGEVDNIYGESSIACQLLRKGSSPDAVEPETGMLAILNIKLTLHVILLYLIQEVEGN